MTWRVLVSAPYMQQELDRYRAMLVDNHVELIVPPVRERLSEAELLGCIADVDGVICGDDELTERVLQAGKKLKVLSKWGTGIDSIDQGACRRLGIRICNTPNAFSEPVADSVLGYMLSYARRLPWMDRAMKKGVWDKIPGVSLSECVLGVIGVGNVGKAVVRRAAAFKMQILGNDLVQMPPDFVEQSGIQMVARNELLRRSDFVSLNCDLNPTSYHLMGRAEFEMMKPTAVVINTCRGPVVDENSLVTALKEGRIAGAALDVFEIEPLPADSPLRSMENVMLAPHNANSSPGCWQRIHENTIRNLLDGLGSDR